ncbi:ketoacyl-synt-domain-containing protein [Exidia glandulosa HHB12029]|uniref:Ketoacyl-synt-domain-containing protein n=1 Tax=Exidia glandulosa HHB12029 TaxID=1314781 RepID=A0A165ZZK5_EXIGL|nr:ketoacyl-synt-domain-containing protein [Exidia glandulosa HHB12029]
MVPVAIIGIAARLPSGTHSSTDLDYQSFNDFLLKKGESYERIPADRLNIDALQGRALGQVLPKNGSFLKNLDKFDHVEFGITARDARAMPVGTRVLIELAFLALLDSGINYRGENVGCYTSAVSHDLFMLSGQDELEARGSFAQGPAMVANRVSYHLDLRGPSFPIDTACSSSLTATHIAAQAISNGECESAVVGGSQINLRVVDWFNYSHGGVLSPDGKCKPFDAHADGFSRGEGAVVMVLKRLDAATRDGDKIYGTILGTAINSNGSRQPVHAPDAVAQEKAMRDAFRRAGRHPSEVDFVELHATGTARGDPTEANWVGRVFKRDSELLIGSVKGNIGHLEITAFLASLCKVCSIFQTRNIPPTVNVSRLNPAIRWEDNRMRVPVPYRVPSYDVARYLQERNGPLNYPNMRINALTHPSLADHVIKDEPIMPASGYLEMALEYGARTLWNIEFRSIIPLSADRPLPVEISLNGNLWSVQTPSSLTASDWDAKYDKVNARGFLSKSVHGPRPTTLDLAGFSARCRPLNLQGFYPELQRFGLQYGPLYRRIESMSVAHDNRLSVMEAVVRIRAYTADLEAEPPFVLHPAILDAAFHAMAHPILSGNRDPALYMLPARIQSVVTHDALYGRVKAPILVAYVTSRKWTPESITWDCVLTDDTGVPLCTVRGLEFDTHGQSLAPTVLRRFDLAMKPLNAAVSEHNVAAPAILPTHGPRSYAFLPLANHLPGHHLIAFVHGEEMQLQRDIASLREADDLTLWFTAPVGLESDAMTGFTRSFRREYPVWNVYCVSFPGTASLTSVREAAIRLVGLPNLETEMSMDERGNIHVPRLTEIASPRHTTSFDSKQPWELHGTSVSRPRPHLPRAGDVIIDIDLLSDSTDAVRAFTGRRRVDGAHVAGLVLPNPTNILCVSSSSLCPLPNSIAGHLKRLPIIALTVCGWALGQRLLNSSSDLQSMSIVVFPSDSPTGQSIVQVLTLAGAQITCISSTQSDYDIALAHTASADIVLCGYTDAAKLAIAGELLANPGTLYPWNHVTDGIPGVLKHSPWVIGNALSAMLPLVGDHIVECPLLVYDAPVEILRRVSPAAIAGPVHAELFDSHRAYVLVGGIGSLGVQIALWMYKHGARNLVLTSRSGKEGLIKRNDITSLRVLAYLEAQQDLSISLNAIDATDEVKTGELLSHITVPIAGCVLASALFVDHAFRRHTKKSYAAAFAPKVTAFRVLEKLLDIASLDWFLAISSFMAFLGNPGQTSYASANAILNGLLQPYPNACAIAAPLVNDSFLVAAAEATQLKHLSTWGYTIREFCSLLEDCILLLRSGPVGIYVPDFAWEKVAKTNGIAAYFQHLLKESATIQERKEPTSSIDAVILKVLEVSASDFTAEAPLTSYGLDSLSAARLAQELQPFVKVTQIQLLSGISTNGLRTFITKSEDDGPAASTAQDANDVGAAPAVSSQDTDTMLRLVEELAQGLRRVMPVVNGNGTVSSLDPAGSVILVTGTTGTVGAAILASLAALPSVSKIYAVNRAGDDGLEERQRRAFETRGLIVTADAQRKIVQVPAILYQPDFGVGSDLMKEMQNSVTTIIHNAWPVNFNIPLSAFRETLDGMKNLISFALASPHLTLPRFIFVSSTATIDSNAKLEASAVEVLSTSPADSRDSGYAKAKWVAESLLARASDLVPNFQSTSIRVGNVSAAPNGAWEASQWVPAMLAASRVTGSVPSANTDVTWIPLASVAAAISDIVLAPNSERVLHLVHPRPVQWSTLMTLVSTELGVNVEGFDQWVGRLEVAARDEDMVKSSPALQPALRLLDFFRHMRDRAARASGMAKSDAYDGFMIPRLDMHKMLAMSPSLQNLPPLGVQDVRSWLAFSAA